MNKYLFIFVLNAGAMIITPLPAYAIGIQVSPARLEISVQKPSEVKVFNPTSDVMIFDAYMEEFEKNMDIMPKSFTLEAGAAKTITLTPSGSFPDLENSVLSTNLAIVATPLSSSLVQLGAGVKVPITFTGASGEMEKSSDRNILAGFTALSILLAAWALQKKVRK